ncbi:SCO family protein [Leptothrix discophora]|uniref:SCO family protein n=1 Tax=Leptothrix discophora TaxID=89 RepID=A0ABT9G0B9_LEPDI|nr:SCO family protein [Leptothrix discophora]MDP4299865.1 SCO family protein [Leptothrix discophora]
MNPWIRRISLIGGIAVVASIATTVVLAQRTPPASASPASVSPASASPASARAVVKLDDDGGQVWGASYFPNTVLTDQFGRKHRFFEDLVKNKVVAINTFFTSCSASCGLETARMREVQLLLGDRVGKDVFFYSITIDPLTDTPEEMKKYADRYQAGPGWLFLTGNVKEIEQIRRKIGLFDDEDLKNPNPNDHRLHSVIGNQKTGRWMRASPFENPTITATQIGSWLHNYKAAPSAETRFELAPQILRNPSAGEKLFRTRCASCHSVNAADQSMAAQQKIGPNLDGIGKRRPRDWLEKWVKAPDRMIADKDPIALAVYNQYNKITMPNMRLEMKEVREVLDFIDEESALPQNDRRIKQ